MFLRFEETIKAIRQAKAMMAFNTMRSKAVAKFWHSKLITRNLKHFPDDPDILSVAEFLDQYEKKME